MTHGALESAAAVLKQHRKLIAQKRFSELFSDPQTAPTVRGAIGQILYCAGVPFMEIMGYVPSHAFYCSNLSEIIIPQNVAWVGECAFSHCDNITQLTVPSSVTDFHQNAFEGCANLEKVNIEGKIEYLARRTFYGCGKIRRMNLDWLNNNNISMDMFAYCSNLFSISIPKGVTHIKDGAFRHCDSLVEIVLPSSINWIDKNAFYQCNKLLNIYYDGPIADWKSIRKGDNWNYCSHTSEPIKVHCTNGDFLEA